MKPTQVVALVAVLIDETERIRVAALGAVQAVTDSARSEDGLGVARKAEFERAVLASEHLCSILDAHERRLRTLYMAACEMASIEARVDKMLAGIDAEARKCVEAEEERRRKDGN